MMKAYVFGNPFLEDDNLAFRAAKSICIEGIEFLYCRSPDELLNAEGSILLLDVVSNIKKVKLITDIRQLETFSFSSLHDFDLAFFLKLLKKLGKIKKVMIIGVPSSGKMGAIKESVKNALLKALND